MRHLQKKIRTQRLGHKKNNRQDVKKMKLPWNKPKGYQLIISRLTGQKPHYTIDFIVGQTGEHTLIAPSYTKTTTKQGELYEPHPYTDTFTAIYTEKPNLSQEVKSFRRALYSENKR